MQGDAFKFSAISARIEQVDFVEALRGLLHAKHPPASLPYTLHAGTAAGELRIAFHDRVERGTVLALQETLCTQANLLSAVRLDVSAARDLTIRAIAALAMLCAAVERAGIAASVSGMPERLRRDITRAQLHHLVNLD